MSQCILIINHSNIKLFGLIFLRNLKDTYSYLNMVHGKPNEKEVVNLLNDCTVNNDVVLQQEYLKYINSLRKSLKKRIPDTLFVDMSEELFCLDKVTYYSFGKF